MEIFFVLSSKKLIFLLPIIVDIFLPVIILDKKILFRIMRFEKIILCNTINYIFMKKEVKTPSALRTRFEIWHFLLNNSHRIPDEHHLNLANGRGCSRKNLLKYFAEGFLLKKEAVLHLLQNCDLEMVKELINQHHLCEAAHFHQIDAIPLLIQRLGVKTLFEKGIRLPSVHIRKLLLSGKSDVIKQYIKLIYFEEEDKILLLQKKNKALTTAFLQTRPALSEEASKLLLSYDDDVLKLYFHCCKHSDFIRIEVIQNKSADVFRKMLESSLHKKFSFTELKLLLTSGSLEKLDLYFSSGMSCESDDAVSFIISHASDEMFKCCIEKANFSLLSASDCERLFEPKFRPLLLKNIYKHAVYSADTEIKLLESNDAELIAAYQMQKDQPFYEETVGWIFANGLQDKYHISADDFPTRNWQLETKIFTSGNCNMIEDYLFGSEAYQTGLTNFGEAQLILHAPMDIIDKYLDENSLCDLAEKAMITRWDDDLFSLFFDKHNNYFNDENTVMFLAKADTEKALNYLRTIENLENFCSEYPDVLVNLCKRKDKAVYKFILEQNFILSEKEIIAFIKNAPVDQIHLLLEQISELDEEPEAELLRHPDKEFVKFYLENYELYSENEYILLERFDPELLKTYDADNFNDGDATDCLL